MTTTTTTTKTFCPTEMSATFCGIDPEVLMLSRLQGLKKPHLISVKKFLANKLVEKKAELPKLGRLNARRTPEEETEWYKLWHQYRALDEEFDDQLYQALYTHNHASILNDVSTEHTDPYSALVYALDFSKYLLKNKINTRNTFVNAHMRRDLPYQITSHLINRDYNPVGSNLGKAGWSKWEEYPNLALTDNWHTSVATKKLYGFSTEYKDYGYVFHDGSAPWYGPRNLAVYIGRLEVLEAHVRKSR